MHTSFFSYNLTRPYPYWWFTPIALVGGAVLLVLLSVVNFVSNSYVLEVEFVNDPNATISNGIWYSNWPSYLTSSVKPTCQPADLPVGTQFFTNQSGFTWSLTNVWREGERTTALPSLTYQNNPFDQCEVRDVQMQFGGSTLVQTAQRNGTIVAASDAQVQAFVTCHIWTPAGPTGVNMTAVYDTISTHGVAGTTAFVAQDKVSKASMYWAEVLLSAWWLRVEGAAGGYWPWSTLYDGKGMIVMYPSEFEQNITSLDFFDVAYSFLIANGTRPTELTLDAGLTKSVRHYTKFYNDNGGSSFILWQTIDGLAKSMYSAVLTDLGQVNAPVQSNIVASSDTLEYFTSNFTYAVMMENLYHLPLVEPLDYDAAQNSSIEKTGPLRLTPSIISTEYLCQIPRRRPWGDIFIAVLLADLVLLQAAWKLYTFAVDQALTRTTPEAKYCEACLGDIERKPDPIVRTVADIRQRLKGGSHEPTVAILNRRDSGSSIVSRL